MIDLFPTNSLVISSLISYAEYLGKMKNFAIALYNHADPVVISAIGVCGM